MAQSFPEYVDNNKCCTEHWSGKSAPKSGKKKPVSPYHELLGDKKWSRLPPEIQKRFSSGPGTETTKIYKGYSKATCLSVVGRILANLLRFIGAPLPLDTQTRGGLPAIVSVTHNLAERDQFWVRQYFRRGKRPQVIISNKKFQGPTGLEEHVAGSVGMTLKVIATQTSLEFHSERYFCAFLGKRFYLPNWITPGRMAAIHQNLSGGRFEFSLTLTHRHLGRLIEQSAIFFDPE